MKELEYKSVEPKVEKFNPEQDLIKISELYAEVFAGPPWNEYVRCMDCKEFFGLGRKPEDRCSNCSGNLTLAYPLDETKRYVMDETQRKNASAFTMKDGNNLIGFVWGFAYPSANEFAKEKYRTPQMQNAITRLLEANGVTGTFFYFSECGVRVDQRGKGFSSLLSGLLLEEASKTKLPTVMRTNWESPMVAVAQRFQMKQIMGPTMEIDKVRRTIVSKKGTVINFTDMEIEERVLFMLQSKI